MKTLLAFTAAALLLSACGSDEKTTIIHERPVVVNQTPAPGIITTPDNVESTCKHGYDNSTRSCY